MLIEAADVLERTRAAIVMIEAYQGCLTYIQKVFSGHYVWSFLSSSQVVICLSQSILMPHDDDLRREVFTALAPNIDIVKHIYELSVDFGTNCRLSSAL